MALEVVPEVDDPAVLNDPQVQELLAQYNKALEENPLYAYKPHDKQHAFHSNRRKVKVFLGGNRSGKSTAGVLDDIIQAVDRDVVPEHLQQFKIWEPPFKCRIITPDLKRSHAAVIETLRRWVPRGQLRGGSFDKAYEKQEKILHFSNGSFIEFMSSEQDLDQFGGSTRHRIHYDEEPDGDKGEAIREECSVRLWETRGDELFTFTPLNGLGWCFDEFEEEKGPEVEKEVWLSDRMVVVGVDVEDNSEHLPMDEVLRELDRLPEKVREARKSGKFAHFKGLVYEMWDRDLHVVPKATRKHVQGLELMESIDPGVNTTAVIFGGFDKDNCLLIYDELFLHDEQAIPENAAELIRRKREAWGVKPKYTLIDPASRNREQVTQQTVRGAYKRAGIKTVKAKNDVEPGVFEVMRRLENKDKEGNDAPLLYVAENCRGLIKEIGKYRIKETTDGKFAVVKKDDHGCDAMRYLCAARPTLPSPPRRPPRPRSQSWIPGTAPPLRPRRAPVGPMGRFS